MSQGLLSKPTLPINRILWFDKLIHIVFSILKRYFSVPKSNWVKGREFDYDMCNVYLRYSYSFCYQVDSNIDYHWITSFSRNHRFFVHLSYWKKKYKVHEILLKSWWKSGISYFSHKNCQTVKWSIAWIWFIWGFAQIYFLKGFQVCLLCGNWIWTILLSSIFGICIGILVWISLCRRLKCLLWFCYWV